MIAKIKLYFYFSNIMWYAQSILLIQVCACFHLLYLHRHLHFHIHYIFSHTKPELDIMDRSQVCLPSHMTVMGEAIHMLSRHPLCWTNAGEWEGCMVTGFFNSLKDSQIPLHTTSQDTLHLLKYNNFKNLEVYVKLMLS